MKRNVREWALIILAFLISSALLTDCFGGHREQVTGTVEDRQYHKAYDELVCNTNTQTNTIECHNEHHSAEYWLYVRSWEGTATVSTTSEQYDAVQEHQQLTYTRIRTRWSNYTWGSTYDPD